MVNNLKSVIYVNYSPYENSGKILDYMLETFEYVFLFSLGFHNIRKKGKQNKLSIFHKGKLQRESSLFQISFPQSLLFVTLPIRSLITTIEIIINVYVICQKHGRVDIFFSVNAFTSCIGVVLKKLRLVSKTIFWVWDYYPPIHESKVIMLVRKIYWFFDKCATESSDRVIFINKRLLGLRKSIGIISKKKKYPIISIGTDIFKINLNQKKTVVLGFIGVLKKSQGLETIFDNADNVLENFQNTKCEIVGSGPDEEYFRERAKNTHLRTTFHGYCEGESFNDVLKKCSIGMAVYKPDLSNVSHYGDAGKVKIYLSLGLPVIITDVFEFSEVVEKNKAGVIIRYGNSNDLIEAIRTIMGEYKTYQKNALSLGSKYYYKKIYPEIFRF